MEINKMAAEECKAVLEHASLGRLGCSYENQPYVVPTHFAYDSGYLYERKHASSLLAKRSDWRLNALGERQVRVGDKSIEPVFFRVRIHTMSGLRAADEKESCG